MLHMFHTYVASVLSTCCVCAMVFKCFQVFLQVFQTHVSSVFFLYVASIASRYFKSRSCVAHAMHVGNRRGRGPPQGRAKRRHRRVARAPRGHAKWGVKTDCNHGHPDVGVWLSVWTLAVPLLEGTLILDQGCCLINHFFLFYFEPLHTSPGVHAKCQPHRFSLPRQPRPLDCKQE
jgi:hypothetical protein